MNEVTCHVHLDKKMPRNAAHSHHKVPRAAGGDNSTANLVWLCPDCHHALHQMATMAVHGKGGEMLMLASALYPHTAQRKKIMDLVGLAAEGMIMKKTGGVVTDHVIPVVVTHDTFMKLQIMARDHRHGGRPVGVAKFVQALAIRELRGSEEAPPPPSRLHPHLSRLLQKTSNGEDDV